MLRAGVRVPRGLRWGALGLATLLGVTAIADSADARARRHRSRAAAAESYNPAYASIVVDANSGAVMQASNADSPRHPASLTKIMTLYLLFERLESGKIKLSTEMPVSAHAAAQAPSKLALKPGETIKVETAIRAIVTKSANDVAVIVAEALGGDESSFARHDDRQGARARHEAHDLSQRVRPARRSADHHRARSGHSRPRHPGSLPAVLSLFLHPDLRRSAARRCAITIICSASSTASTASRPAISTIPDSTSSPRFAAAIAISSRWCSAAAPPMRATRACVSLIDNNINVAAVKRTAPPVVEGWETAARQGRQRGQRAKTRPSRRSRRPRRRRAASPPAPDAPTPGSTDPIKPNAVKTFTVQAGSMRTTALSPLPSDSRKLIPAPATANPASVTTVATIKGEPLPPPAARAGRRRRRRACRRDSGAAHKVASAGDSVPVPAAIAGAHCRQAARRLDDPGRRLRRRERRQGASELRRKARPRTSSARADPFTERVAKGDKTMFRARFAGLDKDQAETACKNLKRSEIPCMLLKN